MLKKVLSALACFAMLAVMLGFGASGGRGTVDAIGIGVIANFADFVRVRKAPSSTAENIAVLKSGLEVTVLAEENGFYQIIAEIEGEGKESGETVKGYVRTDLICIKSFFKKGQKDEK